MANNIRPSGVSPTQVQVLPVQNSNVILQQTQTVQVAQAPGIPLQIFSGGNIAQGTNSSIQLNPSVPMLQCVGTSLQSPAGLQLIQNQTSGNVEIVQAQPSTNVQILQNPPQANIQIVQNQQPATIQIIQNPQVANIQTSSSFPQVLGQTRFPVVASSPLQVNALQSPLVLNAQSSNPSLGSIQILTQSTGPNNVGTFSLLQAQNPQQQVASQNPKQPIQTKTYLLPQSKQHQVPVKQEFKQNPVHGKQQLLSPCQQMLVPVKQEFLQKSQQKLASVNPQFLPPNLQALVQEKQQVLSPNQQKFVQMQTRIQPRTPLQIESCIPQNQKNTGLAFRLVGTPANPQLELLGQPNVPVGALQNAIRAATPAVKNESRSKTEPKQKLLQEQLLDKSEEEKRKQTKLDSGGTSRQRKLKRLLHSKQKQLGIGESIATKLEKLKEKTKKVSSETPSADDVNKVKKKITEFLAKSHEKECGTQTGTEKNRRDGVVVVDDDEVKAAFAGTYIKPKFAIEFSPDLFQSYVQGIAHAVQSHKAKSEHVKKKKKKKSEQTKVNLQAVSEPPKEIPIAPKESRRKQKHEVRNESLDDGQVVIVPSTWPRKTKGKIVPKLVPVKKLAGKSRTLDLSTVRPQTVVSGDTDEEVDIEGDFPAKEVAIFVPLCLSSESKSENPSGSGNECDAKTEDTKPDCTDSNTIASQSVVKEKSLFPIPLDQIKREPLEKSEKAMPSYTVTEKRKKYDMKLKEKNARETVSALRIKSEPIDPVEDQPSTSQKLQVEDKYLCPKSPNIPKSDLAVMGSVSRSVVYNQCLTFRSTESDESPKPAGVSVQYDAVKEPTAVKRFASAVNTIPLSSQSQPLASTSLLSQQSNASLASNLCQTGPNAMSASSVLQNLMAKSRVNLNSEQTSVPKTQYVGNANTTFPIGQCVVPVPALNSPTRPVYLVPDNVYHAIATSRTSSRRPVQLPNISQATLNSLTSSSTSPALKTAVQFSDVTHKPSTGNKPYPVSASEKNNVSSTPAGSVNLLQYLPGVCVKQLQFTSVDKNNVSTHSQAKLGPVSNSNTYSEPASLNQKIDSGASSANTTTQTTQPSSVVPVSSSSINSDSASYNQKIDSGAPSAYTSSQTKQPSSVVPVSSSSINSGCASYNQKTDSGASSAHTSTQTTQPSSVIPVSSSSVNSDSASLCLKIDSVVSLNKVNCKLVHSVPNHDDLCLDSPYRDGLKPCFVVLDTASSHFFRGKPGTKRTRLRVPKVCVKECRELALDGMCQGHGLRPVKVRNPEPCLTNDDDLDELASKVPRLGLLVSY